ncbi:PA3496 family putative envelope integrity protein [Halomonas huangheensis]|nr:hypothetical protein [Halomonas huangheensis]ALM54524.1 hypothetical protein AR456_04610 [Halomonas huangheensis]
MSRDSLLDDTYYYDSNGPDSNGPEPNGPDSNGSEANDQDAVNDDDYGRSRSSSRADTLRARRRVEALLEERRLKQAIDDDWGFDEEEEE